MARIVIELPSEIDSLLRARASKAGYPTAEEYVRALVVADTADPGAPPHLSFSKMDSLEALLLRRLSAPDAGEMTTHDFDQLRRRITQSGPLP